VGSAICLAILATRARRAANVHDMAHFAHDAQFMGEKVLGPISGVLLLMGIFMVLKGYPDFTDTWVLLGIVGWAISAGIGIFYLSPQGGKMGTLLTERETFDTDVAEQVDRVILVSRIDLVLLVLIVADMVFKPGVNG
jgi:hypothetical protein